MTVYREAEMKMFFADEQTTTTFPCQVSISGSAISISYVHEPGYAIYKGIEREPGHYDLSCDKPTGRATLHRFAGDEILEGWFDEEGSEGMWRVELNSDSSL